MNEDIKKMAAKQTVDQISAIGGGTKLAVMHQVAQTGLLPAVNQVGLQGNPVIVLTDFEWQLSQANANLRSHPCGEDMLRFVEEVQNAYSLNLSRLEQMEQQKKWVAVFETKNPASSSAPTFLNIGNTKLTQAKVRQPELSKANAPKEKKPNASRLARMVVEQVRFAIYKDGMYLFENGRYKLVTQNRIKRLLNTFLREEAEKHGFAKLYSDIIDFIDCEQDLVVDDKAFESTMYKIAFANGFLDTINGRFYSPDPRIFFTSNVVLNYFEDSGDCLDFDHYLNQIMGGDQSLVDRIYEVIGIILSNDLNAKAIFCAQGVTNSSKSTLIKFIASFFDEELVTALSVGDMDKNFALSEVIGKALCVDTELPAAPLKTGSVSKLKQLSSMDPLTSDVKYKERVKFICRAKIFLATNHPVQLTHEDAAFMKRIVAIPFYYEIPKAECNPEILKRFEREKLAIAQKAIYYYCLLRKRNYVFSGEYEINDMFVGAEPSLRTQSLLSERDALVRSFLEECCQLTSLDEMESTAVLHSAYVEFCARYNAFPCDQKCLTSILKQMLVGQVEHTKRRPSPGANPCSVLCGLVLK